MSVDTILNYVFKMGNQHVCITGGEPLTQDSVYCLIYDLVDRGYHVNVETNGAVPITEVGYKRSFTYTMDIKCPSSGMVQRNVYGNLAILQAHDEVKFVIGDLEDYVFAKEVIVKYLTKAHLIFSPCFTPDGKSNAGQIAQWLLEDKIPNARLGLQTHRLIGIY